MANHRELKEIAKSRLKAARMLIDKNDYDGAFYLMGHVVELSLKSAICKRLNFPTYPDNRSDDIK